MNQNSFDLFDCLAIFYATVEYWTTSNINSARYICYWPYSEVNMAGYWLSSFLHIMNLDEVQVHQSPNKILANIKPS